MTALPDTTTVLVVGAGPTGLATALSLHHHGISDFVIVDAAQHGDNSSRAVAIHAATLEVLDKIGCGDDVASHGMKSTGIQVKTRSAPLLLPDFASLKPYTRHPYSLHIPQNLTEHVLEKKLTGLGVSIHRPIKAVGMKLNTGNAQLTDVLFEDGRVITARYVVGADGARSVVRTTACIGFADPTPERPESATNIAQAVLADVSFDTPDVGMHYTLTARGMLLCAPLPSSYNEYLAENDQPIAGQIYRLGIAVPLDEGDIPRSPSKGYLQELIDRFGPLELSSDPSINPSSKSVCIKDVVWSSRFRNHAAISDTHFTRLCTSSGERAGGAILLVGDAAHIHSPISGQGMNLGLRDAVYLGEALAKHMHVAKTKPLGEADMILQDFADVRHARALEVIHFTKVLLTVMGTKHRARVYWWLPISTTTLRDWGIWFAGLFSFMRKRVAWEMSGLGRL